MAEQLLPEGLDTVVAAFDRRLRALEVSPRVGLHLMRQAWGTAADDPSTFGAWEYGAGATAWADDQGGTGSGYPQLAVDCPRRVLLMWSARPISIANAAGYRTAAADVTIAVDGTPLTAAPAPLRRIGNSNAAPVDVAMSAMVVVVVSPGAHTFRVGASWANTVPAAGTLPRLTDVALMVLPLSAV